jgi:lysophospholipase L1-like esterase
MNASSDQVAASSPEPKKSSRTRRLLQNLSLALGTFLFCLLASEVVLRLLGYGNLEIYQPDPALYWRLKPNQNCYTKIGRKPVHINSQGTRGPEFSPDKPAGTLRILSLGDSRTFGWGLSEQETYTARLQHLLQQQAGGGRTIETINAGVNAWSYPQMLVYLRDRALAYHPDFVLVGEANLWTQFSEKNSPEFVAKFMNRVRLKNFLRHFALYHYVVEVKLQAFYGRYRTKFIPVDPHHDTLFKEQQQKDPEALFRSAIEGLCRVALTNHIQPVLLFLPTLTDLDATNASAVLTVKRNLSQQLGVPLIDVTPDLQPLGKALYLEADPVHLNSRGNELVARRLCEEIKRLTNDEQTSHH